MALAGSLPPWLNINPVQDYLGAMQAGSRLGLAARAQDVKEEQAADRLRFAYEQLSAKEQMADNALQGKLQLGQMQQDARQNQTSLMNQLGLARLDQGDLRLQLQREKNERAGQRVFHVGDDLIQINPDGSTTPIYKGTPKPAKPLSPPMVTFKPDTETSIHGTAEQVDTLMKKRKTQADAEAAAAAAKKANEPSWWRRLIPGPSLMPQGGTNAPVATAPKRGDIKRGYRFKGGDPSDKENWEKVE